MTLLVVLLVVLDLEVAVLVWRGWHTRHAHGPMGPIR